VEHVRRGAQTRHEPLHVTVRLVDGLPRLRRRRGYQIVRRAVGLANRFDGARICEISIQQNHVHLMVEANDKRALSRTMRSFGITVAKQLNARYGRRGAVLDDRYHVVVLNTPAQVRAALLYVLGNWRKHGEDRDVVRRMTDRFSSGPYFRGWTEPIDLTTPPFLEYGPLPVRAAGSHLLRVAWKRHGLLSPWERPGPQSSMGTRSGSPLAMARR
jgi:REP element-mobilizing transposase RayT